MAKIKASMQTKKNEREKKSWNIAGRNTERPTMSQWVELRFARLHICTYLSFNIWYLARLFFYFRYASGIYSIFLGHYSLP